MNRLKTLSLVALVGASGSSFALNFNLTSTGNAQADAGFAMAASRWSALFTDDITININAGYVSLGSGILGSAGSSQQTYSYTNVRNALNGDQSSADDATAVANLSGGSSVSYFTNYTSNNPNGSGSFSAYQTSTSSVRMTRANAKALGLLNAHSTVQDASINFSSNFTWDFDPTDGITAGAYDFVGVATHELGHAMGFISGVDGLDGSGGNDDDTDFRLRTLDLFRYSNVGGGNNRAFLAGGIDAFFSFDNGGTMGAQFSEGVSQGDGRQASHWKDNLGLGIMDPTGGQGELLSISANDLQAFDVIGYDAVPEPGTMILFGLGVAGLATRRKAKKA